MTEMEFKMEFCRTSSVTYHESSGPTAISERFGWRGSWIPSIPSFPGLHKELVAAFTQSCVFDLIPGLWRIHRGWVSMGFWKLKHKYSLKMQILKPSDDVWRSSGRYIALKQFWKSRASAKPPMRPLCPKKKRLRLSVADVAGCAVEIPGFSPSGHSSWNKPPVPEFLARKKSGYTQTIEYE